jgi:hypothetical protein
MTPFYAANERAQRLNAPFCTITQKVKTRNEVNLTSDNYGVLSAFICVYLRLKDLLD